jgi:hypothetical protein
VSKLRITCTVSGPSDFQPFVYGGSSWEKFAFEIDHARKKWTNASSENQVITS